MTTALDPAKTSSLITLSNSNRTATRTSGTAYYASSLSEGSDAAIVMYAETTAAPSQDAAIVVSSAAIANSPDDGSINWAGWDGNSIGLWGTGEVYHNGAVVGAFAVAPEAADVIGVYVDRNDPRIWFWNVTKNVVLPDGPGFPITSLGGGPLYLGFTLAAGTARTVNFDGTFVGNILADDPATTRWDGTPVNPVFVTMPAAKGTLVLTRNDAVLKRTYAMPVAKGTLVLTGIANAMKRAVTLSATVRAFVLTGIAAGLNKAGARSMTADRGVFTLTGNDANLARTTAYQMAADAGALVLAGMDAALRSARRLVADAAALLLTGWPAGLVYQPAIGGSITLNAAPGAFTLTGGAVALRVVVFVPYEPVSFHSLQNRKVIRTILRTN